MNHLTGYEDAVPVMVEIFSGDDSVPCLYMIPGGLGRPYSALLVKEGAYFLPLAIWED